MSGNGPVRLTPSLREKLWGRRDLAPWHPDSDRDIGEIWFTAGRELPILVKLLYTSANLSVQVHPGDEDGEPGKAEMWYVLRAEPGAALGLGFREPVSRERLRDASLSGEIEHLLRWIPVKPGDAYFAPPHTVHAIGAGLVLWEIQQNADTTYRLYDFGRPRALHLERAAALAELGSHPGPAVPRAVAPRRERLVCCPHFIIELFHTCGSERLRGQPWCQWLMAVEGEGCIAGKPFRMGEVWLVPRGAGEFAIESDRQTRWLHAWKPNPPLY